MANNKEVDIKSIKDLYREFEQPIFRYLLRQTGSWQIAEDLTQETFYQALISIHRFRGTSKASTWLYKIARNVYLNESRAEIRTKKLEDKIMASIQEDSTQEKNLPEKMLEQKYEEETVLQTLQKLPEQYRTIIILKEVEQLSHNEISEILGKSVASTKVMLYRAKQKFQAEYKRQGG